MASGLKLHFFARFRPKKVGLEAADVRVRICSSSNDCTRLPLGKSEKSPGDVESSPATAAFELYYISLSELRAYLTYTADNWLLN